MGIEALDRGSRTGECLKLGRERYKVFRFHVFPSAGSRQSDRDVEHQQGFVFALLTTFDTTCGAFRDANAESSDSEGRSRDCERWRSSVSNGYGFMPTLVGSLRCGWIR